MCALALHDYCEAIFCSPSLIFRLLPSTGHMTAQHPLSVTGRRSDELGRVMWSALGSQQRWNTENSLAVVMCATPMQNLFF
jgi:hypothetical protein